MWSAASFKRCYLADDTAENWPKLWTCALRPIFTNSIFKFLIRSCRGILASRQTEEGAGLGNITAISIYIPSVSESRATDWLRLTSDRGRGAFSLERCCTPYIRQPRCPRFYYSTRKHWNNRRCFTSMVHSPKLLAICGILLGLPGTCSLDLSINFI